MEKISFKIFEKDFKLFSNLKDKDVGKLVKHICAYVFNGTEDEPKDRYIRTYYYILKGRIDLRQLEDKYNWKKE